MVGSFGGGTTFSFLQAASKQSPKPTPKKIDSNQPVEGSFACFKKVIIGNNLA